MSFRSKSDNILLSWSCEKETKMFAKYACSLFAYVAFYLIFIFLTMENVKHKIILVKISQVQRPKLTRSCKMGDYNFGTTYTKICLSLRLT